MLLDSHDPRSSEENQPALPAVEAPRKSYSWQRLHSVARKELLHILRDPMTLFFTLFIPVVELFMLGYAIDTNVRNIPTVVLDQAKTQESRILLQRFINTDDFLIVREV